MCGCFTLKTSKAKIAELIGLHKSLPLFEPRFNIAPSQPVLPSASTPRAASERGPSSSGASSPPGRKSPASGTTSPTPEPTP
jgi:putative SOS response-associated peptidase YedK